MAKEFDLQPIDPKFDLQPIGTAIADPNDAYFGLTDPNEVEKRADEVLGISFDLELPIPTSESNYRTLTDTPKRVLPGTIAPIGVGEKDKIRAAPERTKWQKFKGFFVGKRPPLAPDADRIEKLTRAFDIGVSAPLRTFLMFGKGMTLNAPDLMWAAIKRITPDDVWVDEVKNMNLEEAMDWAGGYNPSGFQKSLGDMAEFIGRIQTVAPIAKQLGIIGGAPKDAGTLIKAGEMAKLFGTAAVAEQLTKGASASIDPTETEYGYEGSVAVLRDMAIGAIFSLASSGAKAVWQKVWSKLSPSETARALKLLGLKKGASLEQINAASREMARRYHPDKVEGFVKEFKEFVKARDLLRQNEAKDIVFRGQKITIRPKLLVGEKAIQAAKKTELDKLRVAADILLRHGTPSKPAEVPWGIAPVRSLADILGEEVPVTKEGIDKLVKSGWDVILKAAKADRPIAKKPPTEAITAPGKPVEAITKPEAVGVEKAKTPAMKQYAAFKEKYPDTVILMKMGDFYEAFGEDAKVLNKVLGTTMTKRGDTPMAGVPYHAIDPSLKKIIQAGHKVAVVEEVSKERAAEVGKEVQRDVVRIVTPIKETPPTQAKPKAVEVKKPKFKARPGFVDLTPIAEAQQQVKTTKEKAVKHITRFGGVEPKMRKALIEYEEQVRDIPKVIAKDAIEKFGKLTTEQEILIENHRENPKKYPDLPEELKPHLETLEKGIDEYGKKLEALGYPADWPNTYSKRLEAILKKEQAKKEPNTEKIKNIQMALKEAEDLQYLHHYYQKTPAGKRIWANFRRRISKRPTGVLGRKIPTYEKAEELGLKRAPLAVSYAHMAHEIARAEMADDLIRAINDNPNLSLPEDQAPDDWVRLDERIFPASVQHQAWIEEGKAKHKRIYRKYPIPIVEALEEITYSRGNEAIERAYDKLNYALKIIGFYNPLVMTKNDAIQLWRAAGVKGFAPLVLPDVDFKTLSIRPPKAIQIWAEKGPKYQMLRKAGLFNNIVSYTPAVTEITEQMLNHIRETSGEKAARIIGEHLNPLNLLKNMRKYNDMSTWNIDEIIRIATYEAVEDSPMLRGMTDFEKVEWVNDAMVNYGKMPKSTKRWIGKGLFVPTYRISNFKFFWAETARVYKGQWRHAAPIVRTVAYKMFIQWGLPAIVASAIFYKTGEERDVRTEKGYRLVIHNPETNTDTVYALSDPLLEGAKLTQRTLRHTLALNLAPIPSLIVRASGGPRFKQSDDPFGEFFKLGTPVYRDVLNWKDPDKTVPQKILTQMAIAFVYTRRGREQDKEKAITALTKSLSIWTDWKEQAADLKKMVSGRSYYLGPGGKFGRLFREYYNEQDVGRAEIDKKIDSHLAKGEYEKAIRIMIDGDRYETFEGISGRLLNYTSPLFSYWQTMGKKQQSEFINWLVENKYYSEQEVGELKEALTKAVGEKAPQKAIKTFKEMSK